MKFLCLDCDEPMKLHSTEGPDEGSLSVTFRCPECGFRVAMLTNPFETQMVRSLGVKVGGATPPAPFEHARTSTFRTRPGPRPSRSRRWSHSRARRRTARSRDAPWAG